MLIVVPLLLKRKSKKMRIHKHENSENKADMRCVNIVKHVMLSSETVAIQNEVSIKITLQKEIV